MVMFPVSLSLTKPFLSQLILKCITSRLLPPFSLQLQLFPLLSPLPANAACSCSWALQMNVAGWAQDIKTARLTLSPITYVHGQQVPSEISYYFACSSTALIFIPSPSARGDYNQLKKHRQGIQLRSTLPVESVWWVCAYSYSMHISDCKKKHCHRHAKFLFFFFFFLPAKHTEGY